jgi:hypothetical protein
VLAKFFFIEQLSLFQTLGLAVGLMAVVLFNR